MTVFILYDETGYIHFVYSTEYKARATKQELMVRWGVITEIEEREVE